MGGSGICRARLLADRRACNFLMEGTAPYDTNTRHGGAGWPVGRLHADARSAFA